MNPMSHFIELLITNAPGWIGMVILAVLMREIIRKLPDDDD